MEVLMCECSEKGKDGTKNHSGNAEFVAEISFGVAPEPVRAYPCENHIENYIRNGWKTKQVVERD
jgi:hypothetical protein